MLILLQQLNYTAHEKEAVLQCEESGSKVANLQGFLAGVRAYKKVLRDNGYAFDIKFDNTDFEDFKELWRKAVNVQKDQLFYTSEKGRDLHFTKGWYEAMSATERTIQRLHTKLEAEEKKAAERPPFDDDSE